MFLLFCVLFSFASFHPTASNPICEPECPANTTCSKMPDDLKPKCYCEPGLSLNDSNECVPFWFGKHQRCNKDYEWTSEPPSCEPGKFCCCSHCASHWYCSQVLCGGTCCD